MFLMHTTLCAKFMKKEIKQKDRNQVKKGNQVKRKNSISLLQLLIVEPIT